MPKKIETRINPFVSRIREETEGHQTVSHKNKGSQLGQYQTSDLNFPVCLQHALEPFASLEKIYQIPLSEHDEKFHEKAVIVARVESVPDGEKEKCHGLTDFPHPQPLQPLVDVLGAPVISVDVEREYVMMKT